MQQLLNVWMALDARRRLALDLYQHGVAAVDPRPAVIAALQGHALSEVPSLRLLAAGKAATAMAQGAYEVLGERIRRSLVATPVDPLKPPT